LAGEVLSASVSLSNDRRVVTLMPDEALEPATPYVLTLTTGIQSAAGEALAEDFTSSFTTAEFAIVFPRDGETVPESQEILLEARASAFSGIADVVFSVNGEALAPVAAPPPFTSLFATPAAVDVDELSIVASGRDATGSEIVRDEIRVRVVPGFRFSSRILGVPLGGQNTATIVLSTPAPADLEVTLQAVGAGIVGLPATPVVFPAGETRLSIPLAGESEGATTVIASAASGQAALIVAVHPPQPGREVRAGAPPAGVRVHPLSQAAQVVALPGSTTTVRVPLLRAPASGETPVAIVSDDPAVANVTGPVAVPEGERDVSFEIAAGAEGSAILTLTADGAVVGIAVRVGPSEAPALATAVGVDVHPASQAAKLIAVLGATTTVRVSILREPASGDTPVVVVSDNPIVASVTGPVVVADGERSVSFDVVTVLGGNATLTLSANGEVVTVAVVAGSNDTPALAIPVGVSVRPAPRIARVRLPAGTTEAPSIRLLSAPAGADLSFSVVSTDPAVATAAGPVTVPAGERAATLEIVGGAEGIATLTLAADGIELEIEVIVGAPPEAGSAPALAVPVGVEVEEDP
jgi:hypothetical protein